jgi:DNA-directed RNA polymerase subunit RPC12/RpoP
MAGTVRCTVASGGNAVTWAKMIEFQCEKCGKNIKAPYDRAGKTDRCPACKSKVIVPVADDPSKTIICPNPNCGYRGMPTTKQKGSLAVMALLFLCGVLPAIIYAAAYSGSQVVCPKCGVKIRD